MAKQLTEVEALKAELEAAKAALAKAANRANGGGAKVTIEGEELVIRLPLTAPKPSSSGKTKVVASTHGNQVTDAMLDGNRIIIGVNAYIK